MKKILSYFEQAFYCPDRVSRKCIVRYYINHLFIVIIIQLKNIQNKFGNFKKIKVLEIFTYKYFSELIFFTRTCKSRL